MWKLSSAEKDKAVIEYLAGASSTELGERFGIDPTNIRGILRRRGVTMRSQCEAQKRCTLREDAFDVLTPAALYWAGFIAADGCLGVRKTGAPFLAVVLAERDREHLVALRSFLGSTHALTPITRNLGGFGGGPALRFSVRSNRLHARLTELGVRGPGLADELLDSRDFWRGVVDGDGWVRGGSSPRLELVGYEYLVEPFVTFMNRECRNGSTCRPHKSIYRVGFTKGAAQRAISVLYGGSLGVSLARKQATADETLYPDRNAARTILAQAERTLAGVDDVRHCADLPSGLVGVALSEPESSRL